MEAKPKEIRRNLENLEGNWTLSQDVDIRHIMTSLSEKLTSLTNGTQKALQKVLDDTDDVNENISNATNDFYHLGSNQFIENRTYQEPDIPVHHPTLNEEPDECWEEEIIEASKSAILKGIEIADASYEQIHLGSFNTNGENGNIWVPVNPYKHRTLPLIIGSEAFLNGDLRLSEDSSNRSVSNLQQTIHMSDSERSVTPVSVSGSQPTSFKSKESSSGSLVASSVDNISHHNAQPIKASPESQPKPVTPLFNGSVSSSSGLDVIVPQTQTVSSSGEPPAFPKYNQQTPITPVTSVQKNPKSLFDSTEEDEDLFKPSRDQKAKVRRKTRSKIDTLNSDSSDEELICAPKKEKSAIRATEHLTESMKVPHGGINIFSSSITAEILRKSQNSSHVVAKQTDSSSDGFQEQSTVTDLTKRNNEVTRDNPSTPKEIDNSSESFQEPPKVANLTKQKSEITHDNSPTAKQVNNSSCDFQKPQKFTKFSKQKGDVDHDNSPTAKQIGSSSGGYSKLPKVFEVTKQRSEVSHHNIQTTKQTSLFDDSDSDDLFSIPKPNPKPVEAPNSTQTKNSLFPDEDNLFSTPNPKSIPDVAKPLIKNIFDSSSDDDLFPSNPVVKKSISTLPDPKVSTPASVSNDAVVPKTFHERKSTVPKLVESVYDIDDIFSCTKSFNSDSSDSTQNDGSKMDSADGNIVNNMRKTLVSHSIDKSQVVSVHTPIEASNDGFDVAPPKKSLTCLNKLRPKIQHKRRLPSKWRQVPDPTNTAHSSAQRPIEQDYCSNTSHIRVPVASNAPQTKQSLFSSDESSSDLFDQEIKSVAKANESRPAKRQSLFSDSDDDLFTEVQSKKKSVPTSLFDDDDDEDLFSFGGKS